MSQFDLHRKPKQERPPSWVNSENERKVYMAINKRIQEIQEQIEISKQPLTATERKIAKSVICIELGLSGSYIAKHHELNQYVNGHQRRLNRLSDSLKHVKSQAQANAKRPEAMNKPELVQEVKTLRKKLEERSKEIYVDQLKHLLDAGLAESQIIVKTRLEKLRSELDAAQEANSKLQSAASIIQQEYLALLRRSTPNKSPELSLLENALTPESLAEVIRATSRRR